MCQEATEGMAAALATLPVSDTALCTTVSLTGKAALWYAHSDAALRRCSDHLSQPRNSSVQLFQEATEGVAAAQTAAAKDTRKKGLMPRALWKP